MRSLIVCFMLHLCNAIDIDSAGYILYCPCMGRFGNQAEQFLGSLDFAHKLNRTLVIPPWIGFDFSLYLDRRSTIFVPYDKWFSLNALQNCFPNKIISMEDFMTNIAPIIWTDKNRKIYCPRGAMQRSSDGKTCPAKDGNPFGPFWDNSNIDFNGGSIAFPSYLSYHNSRQEWDSEFPSHEHPILAFMGAPASFPIQERNRILHKCMEWSDDITTKTQDFIAKEIGGEYISLHIRNGPDWVRACDHISSIGNQFMASAQCVGFNNNEANELTYEMCLPSTDDIIRKVTEVSEKHNNIKTLFVGTDKDPMTSEFEKLGFKVVRYPTNSPIMDLALMSSANAFIGNCVSSFTSFVVRQRLVSNQSKPVYFFAYDKSHPIITPSKQLHDEF